MSSTRTMGVSVTDVDTTQQLPLGFEYVEPADATNDYGVRVWIYVFNDEGATAYALGTLVQRDIGSLGSKYDGIVSTGAVSPQRIMGVAQHAIAGQSYGFILKRGIGSVICDGNVTADTAICPDATAGQATDVAAVTNAAIGVALATDAGATSTVLAYLDCRG